MLIIPRHISRLKARCPLTSARGSPNQSALRPRNFTRSNNAGGADRTKVVKASTTLREVPVDIPIPLWYHRLGPVSDFFSWFHKTQVKRPLTVQLCTTLTTYFLSDILAQNIGGEGYDPWRTLRMLTIGGLASIPGYTWFMWLGNSFNYSSKFLSVAVKVCVQQAMFTPVFNTYFFGMQAALTGESFHGVIDRIVATVPTSIVNSCKVWPAVTAITFAFVSPQYRFMFSGLFAICWQAYLSFLNRREEKRDDGQLDTSASSVVRT